ncbi:PREDICTED: uncharacterized protein LOC109227840 [Nicotiana attenuata]|uniref:uncharacterized protein LOC109227840 n=1 Tax=Nicotiana attenuata TaxID=49451 RepID=UPI000905A7F5|nr:PREDICTED: uncharacterized protein LOC109227840 [Nicotiana attenuata]
MRLALLGKDKLGFVEGTCVKRLYKGELADLWEQCNVIVLSWIGRCVSHELLPSIVYASNAAKQLLVQILVGLNETYAHVRSQILLKTPVLSVNEAYALVIQEKNQRALGVMDMNKEPLTMLASRGQMMKGKRFGVVCEHCGYKGHQKENCYRIMGYPPNLKSKRKPMQEKGAGGFKTYANNATVERNNSAEGHSSIESQSQGHYFTEDEYKQLVDMLNKSSAGDCKVNMAGLYSGKVMEIGRETDGLYILREAIKPVAAAAMIKGNYNMAFKNQFGMNVKVLKSDNGTEFFNSKCSALFSARGITYQSSCPYTPQQNVLKGKSPYEILLGKAPKLEHLKVLGYLCYASVLPRDVSFRETVFPFKERNYGDNEDGDSFLLDRTPTESMTSATPEARPQTTNSDNGQDNVSNTSSEGTHLENTADVEENLANSEANINPNSTDNISDSSMPAEMSQQQIVTIEQDAGEQTIDQNTGEQLEELAAGNQYDNQESNKGRPTRFSKPPIWLNDYVTGKKTSAFCQVPINAYISYDYLPESYLH